MKQQGPRLTGFFQSPSRWIFWPHLMPAEDRQFCCRSNPSRWPHPPAAFLLHPRLYYRWNAATQSAQLPPFPDPISKLTDITARFASGLGSKQKCKSRSNQCTRKQCSSGVPVQNFISHRSFPFLRTTTVPDSDPIIGHAYNSTFIIPGSNLHISSVLLTSMFKIAHPISDSGFRIPDSGFQTLDFRIQFKECSESGILYRDERF